MHVDPELWNCRTATEATLTLWKHSEHTEYICLQSLPAPPPPFHESRLLLCMCKRAGCVRASELIPAQTRVSHPWPCEKIASQIREGFIWRHDTSSVCQGEPHPTPSRTRSHRPAPNKFSGSHRLLRIYKPGCSGPTIDPAGGSDSKQAELPCRGSWQTVNHHQGQEALQFLKTWSDRPLFVMSIFFLFVEGGGGGGGPWSPAIAEYLTSPLCHAALAAFITLSQIHLSSLLTVQPFHFCWSLLSSSKSSGCNGTPAAQHSANRIQ